MTVDIERLMERFGDLGATTILKVDGERPEDAGRWTLVISGGTLAEVGPIRMPHTLGSLWLRAG